MKPISLGIALLIVFSSVKAQYFYKDIVLTQDLIARQKLYQQMDQLIINDAPVIPLWYDQVIRLVNPKISGFHANGLNLLELRRVRK